MFQYLEKKGNEVKETRSGVFISPSQTSKKHPMGNASCLGTKLIPKGYELRHTKTLRVQDLSLGPPERELLGETKFRKQGVACSFRQAKLPRNIPWAMLLGSQVIPFSLNIGTLS
jgi:hypothetical protein